MSVAKLVVAFAMLFSVLFNIAPYDAHAAMLSTKQEIELGSKYAKEFEEKYGLVNDAELQERVNFLGQKITNVSDRKDITYTFKVVDNKEVNAVAIPGGFVYVFKGLVDYMPTDEELSGVLAHEVTHVVKRHSVHQMEKNLWTTAITILAGVLSGNSTVANLAPYFGEAVMAGYSRKDEKQADTIGFDYLMRAKNNPYAMYVAMSKLNDLPDKGSYGIFSSHPDSQARLRDAKKRADTLNIPQKVVLVGNSYKVVDGRYTINVGQSVGSTKAEYRAYLLAGGLYRVLEQDKYPDPNKFISSNLRNRADIYYDETYLYSIYREDIHGDQETLDDAVNDFIIILRKWARAR